MVQRSRRIGAEEKATWHHVTGVGKKRIKRQFFDLTAENEREIEAMVQAHLTRLVTTR